MKWLPETRSMTKPLCSKNWISSRGLTAGSFGILEIQGGNQRFVVGWDGLSVFLEALDITGYSVLRHFLRFLQGASVGHAPGQGRDNGCKTAFRFGAQDNIETAVDFLHVAILSELAKPWSKESQKIVEQLHLVANNS